MAASGPPTLPATIPLTQKVNNATGGCAAGIAEVSERRGNHYEPHRKNTRSHEFTIHRKPLNEAKAGQPARRRTSPASDSRQDKNLSAETRAPLGSNRQEPQ